MNDQLQQILIVLINDAIKAKEFVLSELPEVIDQLLMWNMWVNLLEFLLGIVLICLLIFLAIRVRREFKSEDSDWGLSPIYLLLCFTLFVFGFGFIVDSKDWLQILIAPKVYLIEYAASLAK